MMSDKKKKRSITTALIWAASILGATWIARDSAHADKVFFMLMLGSAIAFGLISQKNDCERRLWRKLTGRGAK